MAERRGHRSRAIPRLAAGAAGAMGGPTCSGRRRRRRHHPPAPGPPGPACGSPRTCICLILTAIWVGRWLGGCCCCSLHGGGTAVDDGGASGGLQRSRLCSGGRGPGVGPARPIATVAAPRRAASSMLGSRRLRWLPPSAGPRLLVRFRAAWASSLPSWTTAGMCSGAPARPAGCFVCPRRTACCRRRAAQPPRIQFALAAPKANTSRDCAPTRADKHLELLRPRTLRRLRVSGEPRTQ